MVLRRTKRLCDTVGVDAPLDELVDMQAERLAYENRDTIRDIVRTEVEKYRETLERGGRRVETLAQEYAKKGEPIPIEELIELYDPTGSSRTWSRRSPRRRAQRSTFPTTSTASSRSATTRPKRSRPPKERKTSASRTSPRRRNSTTTTRNAPSSRQSSWMSSSARRVRRRPRSDDVLPRGRRPACGHGERFRLTTPPSRSRTSRSSTASSFTGPMRTPEGRTGQRPGRR